MKKILIALSVGVFLFTGILALPALAQETGDQSGFLGEIRSALSEIKNSIFSIQQEVIDLKAQVSTLRRQIPTETITVTPSTSESQDIVGIFVRGDSSAEVSRIQRCLEGLGYASFNGEYTSSYGPKTERAVMNFQNAQGIAPLNDTSRGSGRFGARTGIVLNRLCRAAGLLGASSGTAISSTARGSLTPTLSTNQTGGGSTQNLTTPMLRALLVAESSTHRILDTTTNQIIKNIDNPLLYPNLALTRDGQFAYSSQSNGSTLRRIDLATGAITTVLDLTQVLGVPSPRISAIILAPDEKKLVLSVNNGANPKKIFAIFYTLSSGVSTTVELCNGNTVCGDQGVEAGPQFISFSSDSRYAFVAIRGGQNPKVHMIDTQPAAPVIVRALPLVTTLDASYDTGGIKFGAFPYLYALREMCDGVTPCSLIRKFDVTNGTFVDLGTITIPAQSNVQFVGFERTGNANAELVVGSNDPVRYPYLAVINENTGLVTQIASTAKTMILAYVPGRNEVWTGSACTLAGGVCGSSALIQVFNLTTHTRTHTKNPSMTLRYGLPYMSAISTDEAYLYVPTIAVNPSLFAVFDLATKQELSSIVVPSRAHSVYAYPKYLSDLTVTNLVPTLVNTISTTNSIWNFEGLVKNLGRGSSLLSSTRLRIDLGANGSWDITAPSNSTGSLTPLTGTELEKWLAITITQAGTHRYEICADATDSNTETNENNNCATGTFQSGLSHVYIYRVGQNGLVFTNPTTEGWTGTASHQTNNPAQFFNLFPGSTWVMATDLPGYSEVFGSCEYQGIECSVNSFPIIPACNNGFCTANVTLNPLKTVKAVFKYAPLPPPPPPPPASSETNPNPPPPPPPPPPPTGP